MGNRKYLDKDVLRKLYIDEFNSVRDIAKILNVTARTVSRCIIEYKIGMRTLKEANKLRCIMKPETNPGRPGMPKQHIFGKDNKNWKGGRSPTNNGYMRIRINGKLVLEHRYIWEQHHCKIPRGYQVHHINGDRLDNRIENFQMVSNSDHQIFHKRFKKKAGFINITKPKNSQSI